MPYLRPRKPRKVQLNIKPDDDESALQLAAMLYAVRDAQVEIFTLLTKRPAEEIETYVDDMYERYLDDLLKQVKAYRETNNE